MQDLQQKKLRVIVLYCQNEDKKADIKVEFWHNL